MTTQATPYQFGTHCDVPDLVAQLTRLSNVAFAEYEGAMPVDESFTAWYLQRPGCRPGLCPVALQEGQLVSNVLVAIQSLQLGGEVLPCGIIDTVATEPEHRGRGLARRLMEDAHDRMRQAGAEAAVLYTNPDGHPYRFYERLGYETRAVGAALLGARPAAGACRGAEPAAEGDRAALCELLDGVYAAWEGYAPMTPELWQWHRVARPPEMPARLMVARSERGQLSAMAALAHVELLIAGEQVPATVISDVACEADLGPHLDTFLACADAERIMTIVDRAAPLYGLLIDRGFTEAVREVAMVLPFTDRAREAMARRTGPWYVMIESVVGV